MHLFCADEALAALSQSATGFAGRDRAAALVELAWHLRQRDAARVLELAHQVPDDGPWQARLDLAVAESSLLLARVDEARAAADRAALWFEEQGDPAGRGDAALIQARIAEVRGERSRELQGYQDALAAYAGTADRERVAHARLWALLASGFGDPASTGPELADIRAQAATPSPPLAAHLRFVEGVAAFQRGAFLEAVPAFGEVVAHAPAWGLLEQAYRAQAGLVSAHSNLGDREASCRLAEQCLARARSLGWPRVTGHALANLARQLADTGQPARAVELLVEARQVLANEPRSRGHAIATYYLGDALLALGRHEAALGHLRHAEALMRDLGSQPEVACLQAIAATALSRLGRTGEALASANAALELARRTRSRLWEVEALRSLAEVHGARHDTAQSAAQSLAFLTEALAVVDAIGGHHEKSQIFSEIARAHEAAGDPVRALAAERAGRAEEVREKDRRAVNQLLLARERYETERQRERAAHLEATLGTLEQLRQVGQEITAHLDAAGMLQSLERQLTGLADVTFIGVFVFDPAGGSLRRHCAEGGRMLPVSDVALADLESYAARAAREGREIDVNAEEGGRAATRIPGTMATRSLWFGPLTFKGVLLGVLTVQTTTVGAYGEREKLIFRTVGSYAAVALANARTHGELEAKHERLTRTEAEMRLLATTDPLSGLANRRQFLAAAESEVARATRYGGAIGLVMADLDRFKETNDVRGHGAGDRLIVAVAEVLRQQQRPHDVIGRLGGDEFAIALPGADLEATQAVAERVRAAVDALRVPWHGETLRATLSLGCASAPEAGPLAGKPADELARLLRTADAALYEAKRQGRNRALAADPPRTEPA